MLITQIRQQAKAKKAAELNAKQKAAAAEKQRKQLAKKTGKAQHSTIATVKRQAQKQAAELKKTKSAELVTEQNALAAASKSGEVSLGEVPCNYELAMVQLQNHRELLSSLPSVDEKIALKAQLLEQYLPFLIEYRESLAKYPNEVLAEMVIWLIDCDQIHDAMDWADFAINQQQSAPERFKRDLPTIVAEMIHDWAERQYKAKQSAAPYFDTVVDRLDSEQWIVPQVIALTKVFKLAALFAEREDDWATAVKWFEKCVAVNPEKHGVKTKLSAAQAKLVKAQ
jgi:hypothetical protein